MYAIDTSFVYLLCQMGVVNHPHFSNKKPHHYDEAKRTKLTGSGGVEKLTTKYCELSTGVTTPSRVWG